MNEKINKVLIYIIGALAFIIIFCTITALCFGKASIGNAYRKKDPTSVSQLKLPNADLQEFKEFGTLRALTKPEDDSSVGVNLVVTPWLCYDKKDSAFYEELSYKKKNLTNIFMTYFASHTQKELYTIGEKKIKEELLNQINEQLIFGKIKAVYFDDYFYFD